ncbi:MAG: hypothetical protein LBT70_00170 [Holosporaceae bacterium]|jgi:hypothetical protein|nr:hypothetical protein [Holosporaceae bacterium]
MTTTNTENSMIENVFIPLKIVKRGSHSGKILSKTYSVEKTEPNETLVAGILKAYLWEKIIYEQFDGNFELFCINNKFSKRYVQQILKLNLLSPKLKEAILTGNHPKHLLLRDLVRKPFPVSWIEQEKMMGFRK